ncbi:hypothetical protein [Azohydromonas lata]|uniref:hypothetical protein n=1 Tax=Azohydromonas lata TaxID=45677 RepID=UPI00082F4FE5|nr:hypothetical protein [Azohydromonas lata]
MFGGLFVPSNNQTSRLFRLTADGGDTAAPGNTTLRAMAGCVCTVAPNALRVGDLLRIYCAIGRGLNQNSGTETVQAALYAGPNGNLTDTAISSFGVTTNTTTTTAGWSTEWRIISNTTMRKQGAGAGFSSLSAQISNIRPAIDTIPSIATGFKLTLAAAMSTGTDWCVVSDFRVYIER